MVTNNKNTLLSIGIVSQNWLILILVWNYDNSITQVLLCRVQFKLGKETAYNMCRKTK